MNISENKEIAAKKYKDFIDSLVNLVKKMDIYLPDENTKKFSFLRNLSKENKILILETIREAYIAGIHDALARMDGMQILENGIELSQFKFTDMHHDFIGRLDGQDWIW